MLPHHCLGLRLIRRLRIDKIALFSQAKRTHHQENASSEQQGTLEISQEEGVSLNLLQSRHWPNGESSPNEWTSSGIFSAVVETTSLNEEETAQYCRQKGVFPEELKKWLVTCENVND
jgi:hypothetical protein